VSSQAAAMPIAAVTSTLSVRDIQVDRSTFFATFTIVLAEPLGQTFSVDYGTVNGSAHAGADGDYLAAVGTLHFAAGQTTQTVSVPLAAAAAQGAEWFGLRLGAVHGPGAAFVTIGDGLGQALLGVQGPAALSPYLSIADVVTGEGAPYLEFVATLSAPSASAVSFSYKAYAAGQPGQLLADTSVTIPAGATQQVIRLPLTDDAVAAAARNIVLETSQVTGARAERTIATGTILDNDTTASGTVKALLSVSTVAVDESAGLVTFALTLDKTVDAAFSVRYGTADGSAIADPINGDYLAAAGSAYFGAGELVQFVTVALRDDALPEQAESFSLHLSTNPTGAGVGLVSISTTPGQAWIGRSDLPASSAPTLTAASLAVGANESYAEFTLTLSAPATEHASASLVLVDAMTGATASVVGTIDFQPGTTLQTVRVLVGDGSPFAADKAYALTVGVAENLSVPAGTALATLTVIEGDPTTSAVPFVTVHDAAVDEANGTITFSVVLDRPARLPFTLDWHTEDGTASASTDYFATNGVITFGPGDTVQRVTLPLVQDHARESVETFRLVVTLPDGSADARISDGTGEASIRDQDSAQRAFAISARAEATIENGWAEFEVSGTPDQGGPEVAYTISGIEAARVAGGLHGTVTLGADGKALLRLHLLDDLVASSEAALTVTLATGASAEVNVLNAEFLSGTAGDDFFSLPLHRDDRFDGGAGLDNVIVGAVREQFDLARFDGGWRLRDAATGTTQTLVNVERIAFTNGAVALDLDGVAGQAYRLYQAAFDRLPDETGLGFWIASLDNGGTLHQAAAQFLASPEFTQRYGAILDDEAFVAALYDNVFHRGPDEPGQAYWLHALQLGESRARVLVEFSESPEHRAAIVGSAQDGVEYHVFG
jgi:hypothetical protein